MDNDSTNRTFENVQPYQDAARRLFNDGILGMAYLGVPQGPLMFNLSAYGNYRPVRYSEAGSSWMLETPPFQHSSYYPFAHGTFTPEDDRAAQFEAIVREHMATGWQDTVMDKIRVLCG
jgi:hypothetical protein